MLRRTALITLIAMLATVMPASPAGARTREGLKISSEIGKVEQEYSPGLAGSSGVLIYNPASVCSNPGVTYCDVVPVDIVAPQLADASDEWVVEIKVGWDDPEVDIDLYVWDNGQTTGSESSPTRIGESNAGANPETVILYQPKFDKVLVVPHLPSGVNLAYTVTVTLKELDFQSPFEVLAPEFGATGGGDGGGFSDASAWSPAPIDYSAVPDDAGPVGGPQFGEIAIQTDDDFSDFGESDFDREIAAPAIPAGTRRSLPPPSDVPGIVALFWLGLVPLILLGLGAFLIRRRSQAAMSFA